MSLFTRKPAASASKGDTRGEHVHFGFNIMLGPKEDVKIYTPFLRYLEQTTGKHFRIRFSERYEDTIENLGTGTTDFAVIGPLGYVMGRKRYGYGIEYLVSGVNREGDPRYYSVIFSRPESDVEKVEDLRGRSFAFGSKMSTQGHLIPRKMLEEAGIVLDDLSHHVFTGSHINTLKSVLNAETDAGGIQATLARRLAEEGKIRIVKMSKPYPSDLIAHNGNVPNETVESVRAALLSFDPMTENRDMLVDWDLTGMALGFTRVNDYDLYKVAVLARKYGLLAR